MGHKLDKTEILYDQNSNRCNIHDISPNAEYVYWIQHQFNVTNPQELLATSPFPILDLFPVWVFFSLSPFPRKIHIIFFPSYLSWLTGGDWRVARVKKEKGKSKTFSILCV